MPSNMYKLTGLIMILCVLLKPVYGQNQYRLFHAEPNLAKHKDTILVHAINLDSANTNYQLFLGSQALPIISITKNSLKTICPNRFSTDFIMLCDTLKKQVSQTSHPIYMHYLDTLSRLKEMPMQAVSASNYINFWNGTNRQILYAKDINGDGQIDFIAQNSAVSGVYLLLNKTTPSWDIDFDTLRIPSGGFIELTALDGQPYPEIVMGVSSGRMIYRLKNVGGKLAIKDSLLIPYQKYFLYGDLNADGKTDIYWYNYRGTSSLTHGIEYMFNLTKDTLAFDSMRFAEMDSMKRVDLIQYTDTGSGIYMGYNAKNRLQALEISSNSTGSLSYKRLDVWPTSGIYYAVPPADLLHNGSKDVIVTNGTVNKVYSYKNAKIATLGSFADDGIAFDQKRLISSRKDSTIFQITTLKTTKNYRTTMKLEFGNDTVKYNLVDTVHNDFFRSEFCDFNGDGYVDVFSRALGRVFPSQVFKLNGTPTNDTVNFLFQKAGEVIFDRDHFLVNSGLEQIRIDSMVTNSSISILKGDSSPFSFPLVLKSGDTLRYLIKFTATTANTSINHMNIHTHSRMVEGPIIRGKKSAGQIFSISKVQPDHFKPGDTINLIMRNFNVSKDSSIVFFENVVAEIDTIIKDTIRVIAPKNWNPAYIIVWDKKSGLRAASSKRYSMVLFNHDEIPVSAKHFIEDKQYHSSSLSSITTTNMMGEVYWLENTSGQRNYFKRNMASKQFKKVGSDVFPNASHTHLNTDKKTDCIVSGNSKLMFMKNTANLTDTFPFNWDTIAIIPMNSLSGILYLDLDKDGLPDLISLKEVWPRKQVVIKSSQYDDKSMNFGSEYMLPPELVKNYIIHDIDGDDLRDILLFNDSAIIVYKNCSRMGQFNFKLHSKVKRKTPLLAYNLLKASPVLGNSELLLVEPSSNLLLLSRLWYDNGIIKLDSISAHSNMGTISTANVIEVDFDANGKMDILFNNEWIFMNRSNGNGISFRKPFKVSGITSSDVIDINGDQIIDIVTNDRVHLNSIRKVDVWSALDRAQFEASYPLVKSTTDNVVILKSSKGAKYSDYAPMYIKNLGLVPSVLTSVEVPDCLEITDSMGIRRFALPLKLDSGSMYTFYIRNNNLIQRNIYRDTLNFIFENGLTNVRQELIHIYTNPPVIDSMAPLRPKMGDTIVIYGHNLLNMAGKAHQVKLKEQTIKPIYSSDTLYRIIFPGKMGNCKVTIVDTLSRLAGTSGQVLAPMRTGTGGNINMDVFSLDTTWLSRAVSIYVPSDLPYDKQDMADLNGDGELDLIGTSTSGSNPSIRSVQVIYDEAQGANLYNLSNSSNISYGEMSTAYNKAFEYYMEDVNRDGKTDILSVDYGSICSGSNVVCFGMSVITPSVDSSFTYFKSSYSNHYAYSGRYDKRGGSGELVHDFNKDGILDVLWRTDSSFIISSMSDYHLFETQPSYGLTYVNKTKTLTLSRQPDVKEGLASVDVDGDGRVDLIDGGRLFLNVSDSGKFKFKLAYDILDTLKLCSSTASGRRILHSQVAYLNKDGKPDLICTGAGLCGTGGTKVALLNKSTPGKIQFATYQFNTFQGNKISSFGDINGDGLSDFLGFSADSLYIFTNKTDTAFRFSVVRVPFKNISAAIIYDLDGDGDEDLILTNLENSKYNFRFYQNSPIRGKLSQTKVNFNTPQFATDSMVVTLKNTGKLDMDIDSFILTSHNPYLTFTVSKGSGNQKLKPDSSIQIKLVFKADSLTTILDTLTIKHNGNLGSRWIYISAKTLTWPRVAVLYDTLNLGAIRVGSTKTKPYQIKNVGSAELLVSDATTGHADFQILNVKNKKVAVGDTLFAQVSATPSTSDSISSNAKIYHNGLSKQINVRLLCEGIAPLVKDTMHRNLGSLAYSAVNYDSFYFKNSGTDTLHVRKIELGKHFVLNAFAKTIAPKDSGKIVYQIRVAQSGSTTDSLIIHHDDYRDSTTSVYVSFNGLRGKLVVDDDLAFSPIPVDSSLTQSLSLINAGNDTLQIDSLKISGTGWFTISGTYTFPIRVLPSDTFKLPIMFRPKAFGAAIAKITCYHNSFGPSLNSFIHGASVVCFDSIKIGSTSVNTFYCLNQTQDTLAITVAKANSVKPFTLSSLLSTLKPSDSAIGTIQYKTLAEGLDEVGGTLTWKGVQTKLMFKGFTVSPVVIPNKTYLLKPTVVGKIHRDTVFLYNTGSDTLFVSSFSHSSQLKLIQTFTQVLAGDSGRIIFEYWTSNKTYQNEAIQINHNYYLNGSTKLNIIFREESPSLFISKLTLDFKDKIVNGNYQDSFYVTNLGNIDLKLNKLRFSGDTNLTVDTKFPLSIEPGKRQYIGCRFKPDSRRSFDREVWMYHNAPGDSNKINLKGNGISSWIDSVITLDTQYASYQTQGYFKYFLKNSGSVALQIDSIISENGKVAVVSTPNYINAGDSVQVSATFTPSTIDVETDIHWVYHDFYGYRKTKVIIPFKGTDAVGKLNPVGVDHGVVAKGGTSKRTFSITNIGEETLEIYFVQFQNGAQYQLSSNPNGKKIKAGDSIVLDAIYNPSSKLLDVDTLIFSTNSKTWKTQNKLPFMGRLKGGILIHDSIATGVLTTKINQIISGTILVRNVGSDTLNLVSAQAIFPSNFVLTLPSKKTLDTAQSAHIRFSYPNNAKKDSTILRFLITHTGINPSLSGDLKITTILPELVTVDSFIFDDSKVNTQISDTFWVYNGGKDTLMVDKISWQKGKVFTGNISNKLMVTPGDSGQLLINFLPDVVGKYYDSIYITSNDPDQKISGIRVIGTGIKNTGIATNKAESGVELYQNIPNPSTGFTSISFNAGNAVKCRLSLYDETGRLVKLLIDGDCLPQLNTITFSVEDLPAGVYHYQLEIEGVRLRKSIVIVKR